MVDGKQGEQLAGSLIYDDLVRRETLEGDLRGLGNENLYCLAHYLKTLPNGGIPGFMSAAIAVEKIRRWDDEYEQHREGVRNPEDTASEHYPEGATTAEGVDSGHRGEEF